MHYNPGSIANVLSLSTVANIPGCRLTMDTEVEKAIIINMENGNELKFVECANGLYYYDTTNFNNKNTINHYTNFDNYNFFINSVVNNKKSYNKKDIAKANEARRMHHLLCWPSTQQFKYYVRNNMLKNYSIDIDDINRAELIYAPPASHSTR